VAAFKGKPIDSLRTPYIVIDRAIFAENCAKMHQRAKEWGTNFRAHLKTHKVSYGSLDM
jgi:D-serine ammonia-lyase